MHAKRLRVIVLPSVACLTLTYLPTLSLKRYDFREKKVLSIKCVHWFPLQFLSKIFLILRIFQLDIIINVLSFYWSNWLHVSALYAGHREAIPQLMR